MADTARSVSDLQALFADNITGNISPQDLRDFLVTSLGVSGGMYMNYNGAGQAMNTNTYTVVDNWTANFPSASISPDAANSQIVVDVNGTYSISVTMSGASSVQNVNTETSIFVDGVETVITQERKIGTANDIGAWGLLGTVSLNAGQAVDVRIRPDKNISFLGSHAQFNMKMVR